MSKTNASHNGRLVRYHRGVLSVDSLTKREVAVLLALGYSNRMIRRSVRVSDDLIRRVVQETGIRRKHYRDGSSEISQWVADKARHSATAYVKPRLLT